MAKATPSERAESVKPTALYMDFPTEPAIDSLSSSFEIEGSMAAARTNSTKTVFDLLKVNRGSGSKSSPKGDVFFQILEREGAYYLQTVNAKGQPVSWDHRALQGRDRHLVKAIDTAMKRLEWRIDWDSSETSGVPLQDHPHLLELLRDHAHLVDGKLKPIRFAPHEFRLELNIVEVDAATYAGRILLVTENGEQTQPSAPVLLNSEHLLSKGTIHRIRSLGDGYENLRLFVANFAKDQANEWLSLLHSSLPAVPIRLDSYTLVRDAPIGAEPAIVFREVDSHAALYLEILHFVPGLSLEFLRDYDVTQRVMLDDIEHLIRVCDIEYHQLLEAEEKLIAVIRKLSRSIKSEHAFWTRSDDGQFILGAELAEPLLRDTLADLAVDFRIFGADKLTAYKIKAPKPKLHLKLGSGINFLEGSAEVELDGERFDLQLLLQQYRKKKYVELSDGSHAVLNQDYMDKLGRLFKKQAKGVRVSFFDLPLVEELIDENQRQAAFPRSREIFDGFNTLRSRRIQAPALRGELRPYQKDGLKWLDYLHTHKLGGCLADDMGLGKTIQVIALLSRIYPEEKKPSLIVMPKSLLLNWRNELERFCPELRYAIYYGAERDLSSLSEVSLLLTTYGTLRNDIASLADTKFHCVILDESQAIKNHQSQSTQAVMALQAEFRVAMSGTPIENNLGELYSLFSFLNPAMFASIADFERDYLNPIQRRGDKDAATELRKKVYPFILRRLKSEVLKELPPKVEQVVYVEMSDAQKRLYETRRQFYQNIIQREISDKGIAGSQFLMLEAMLELRQIATAPEAKSDGAVISAKWEVLEQLLLEAIAGGRKCLVFSSFLAVVEEVSQLLQRLGTEHLIITGATSNRQAIVDRFQNDARVKVMIMTLKTGGVGLNLTAADTVFLMDPWWNTAAEAQAIDRTHRIGQQSTVFAYRLIAKDSIEEKIRTLQLQKQDLANQIISSDGVAMKSLDETDIQFLLGN